MRKVNEVVDGSREFIREVRGEMHKASWPPRSELVESTMVVVVFVIILGVYIGLSDWVLLNVVRLLIGN